MLLAGVAVATAASPVIALLAVIFGLFAASFGPGLVAGFVLPVFHGALIAVSVDRAGTATRARSRKALRFISAVCACFAFYFFLHAQVWMHSGADWSRYIPLLNPAELSRTFERGVAEMSGPGAVLVFGLLVVFFGLYLAPCLIFTNENSRPFCETCGRYCSVHPTTLTIRYAKASHFERGNFKTLIPCELRPDIREFCRVKLYMCHGCDSDSFLRVWQIRRPKQTPGDSVSRREKSEVAMDLLKVPDSTQDLFDVTGDWD